MVRAGPGHSAPRDKPEVFLMYIPTALTWATLESTSVFSKEQNWAKINMSDLNKLLAKWRRDPVAFIGEVLIDPETGKAFELYPAQERFLREALTPKADGRLRFPDSRAPREDGQSENSHTSATTWAHAFDG
jgi:hypothetical protein